MGSVLVKLLGAKKVAVSTHLNPDLGLTRIAIWVIQVSSSDLVSILLYDKTICNMYEKIRNFKLG